MPKKGNKRGLNIDGGREDQTELCMYHDSERPWAFSGCQRGPVMGWSGDGLREMLWKGDQKRDCQILSVGDRSPHDIPFSSAPSAQVGSALTAALATRSDRRPSPSGSLASASTSLQLSNPLFGTRQLRFTGPQPVTMSHDHHPIPRMEMVVPPSPTDTSSSTSPLTFSSHTLLFDDDDDQDNYDLPDPQDGLSQPFYLRTLSMPPPSDPVSRSASRSTSRSASRSASTKRDHDHNRAPPTPAIPPSVDRSLVSPVVQSPSTAQRAQPYFNGTHSATASTSTLKPPGSPLVRAPAGPRQPSTSSASSRRSAVSDASTNASHSDVSSVRRLAALNASSSSLPAKELPAKQSKATLSSASGETVPRMRTIPHLPHNRDAEPAPASVMYWSRAPVWGTLPTHGMRAHSVTLVDHTAWVFGGCDDVDCFKDVWCFHTGKHACPVSSTFRISILIRRQLAPISEPARLSPVAPCTRTCRDDAVDAPRDAGRDPATVPRAHRDARRPQARRLRRRPELDLLLRHLGARHADAAMDPAELRRGDRACSSPRAHDRHVQGQALDLWRRQRRVCAQRPLDARHHREPRASQVATDRSRPCKAQAPRVPHRDAGWEHDDRHRWERRARLLL